MKGERIRYDRSSAMIAFRRQRSAERWTLCYGMPRAALATGAIEHEMAPGEIAECLKNGTPGFLGPGESKDRVAGCKAVIKLFEKLGADPGSRSEAIPRAGFWGGSRSISWDRCMLVLAQGYGARHGALDGFARSIVNRSQYRNRAEPRGSCFSLTPFQPRPCDLRRGA